MGLTVELEQEIDGRWLAEVPELPGVLAYGATRPEAVARVQALALRVIADRLDRRRSLVEQLEGQRPALDAAAQHLADAMQGFVRAHPTQWFHFREE